MSRTSSPTYGATAAHFPIPPATLPDLELVAQALSTFDYFGGDQVLNGAMESCTRALQAPSTISDHITLLKWKKLQATALYLRFERDGLNSDLEQAKAGLEYLLSSPNVGPAMHVSALYGLGRVYEAHNDHESSLASLEKASECYREALIAAGEQPQYPASLLDEINAHLGRQLANLSSSGNVDLSESIALMSRVRERTEDTEPIYAYSLVYLGMAYSRRWFHSTRDNIADLIKAEELARQALQISPHSRHRSRFLTCLASISIYGGTLQGIREGISLAMQAVTLFPTIPPIHNVDRAVLNLMATGYASLFELEGNLADIDEAIKYLRILSPIPQNADATVHQHLCLWLCKRFKATGHLVDIDGAIEASRPLLGIHPTGRYADYARLSMGQAHLLRFGANTEREDFEAAKIHLETGIRNNSTPALHPSFLRALATLYRLRYDMSKQTFDLDFAVENSRQAMVLHEQRQPRSSELPECLSEYGTLLLSRFELQHHPQDLANAALIQESALQSASETYHARHLLLWQFARALRLRFEVFRDPQDSDRCLQLLQDALHQAAAAGVPKQSLYLMEIAALYSALYVSSPRPADLTLSLDHYIKAAETSEGLTSDRFTAAVTGGRLAREHNQLGPSTRLLSMAVSFLPRIAWLGLNASKRHAKLVQTAAQLACDAAAVAIRAHELERAVELLDEGRSVMWRSVLELRTDLTALEDVAPQLARELLVVAQSLEHDEKGGAEVSEKHAEERAARRRRTAERWEELVKQVRAMEGFNTFLRPLNFSVLRQAAQHGPAVLLNVSEYGSDALIVSLKEPVQTIPLPGLELATVRRLAYVMARALHVARDHVGCQVLERVLLDTCRQLWNGGIGAVAATLLDSQRQPRDQPLHVWWIPTGFLSLLPLHCAGLYQVGHPGIPELFVSSYSTTLSALLRARQRQSSHNGLHGPPTRLLAVGLPETPQLPFLPSAHREMEILANNPSLGKYCSYLYGPDATIAAVTTALPHYNWIHASCHGHFDHMHPLDSAFNLMDGPLTLAHIVQMRLQTASFAFLSACHTARHTAFLPDESLHLAAGLQIAGFRGVVGTAWSMVDRDGPRLADRFYHWLTLDGRALDERNAAEALHFAVKDLRETGVPLYRWAPFVHFGV